MAITIAISRGRILKESLPILAKAGILVSDEVLNSRCLILDTSQENIKLLVLRSADVPVFVKHAVADLGIVGKDVLLEKNMSTLYELLDLNVAKCRLMVAAIGKQNLQKQTLKVATKYPKLASDYFNTKSQQIELIKLHGTMELAPIVGLCDCIVDLVDTGGTLKANGLIPFDHILDISARLVVNSATYVSKYTSIKNLVSKIAGQL